MVIDSSALVAILLGEPVRPIFLRAIAGAQRRLLSAVSRLETSMVMGGRRRPAAIQALDLLIDQGAIETVDLTVTQAAIAQSAWERFGKGRHPASLNLGDCCAYALARETGEPLPYKGQDFARTDIAGALP